MDRGLIITLYRLVLCLCSVDDLLVDTPLQAVDKAIGAEINRAKALASNRDSDQPMQPAGDDPNTSSLSAAQIASAAVGSGGGGDTSNVDSKHSNTSNLYARSASAAAGSGGGAVGNGSSSAAAAAAAASGGDSKVDSNTDSKQSSHKPGVFIPDHAELMAALLPLKQLRLPIVSARAAVAKKSKLQELNSVTQRLFENEIKQHAASKPVVPLGTEVILKLSLFHQRSFKKTQEFIVFGSQPLTALRDRIYCLSDTALDGAHTPSSCMFIENRFYNDLRDRRAIKYSEYVLGRCVRLRGATISTISLTLLSLVRSAIVNWVKQDNRFNQAGLSHFETFSMHDTTFNDLSIRLVHRSAAAQ